MNEDHGSQTKCPRCNWKQVTYAMKTVTCQHCHKHYDRKKHETNEPLGNGTGTSGFTRASEMKKQ